MDEPIADDQPHATFVYHHEGRQFVERKDYERLRVLVNSMTKQIAEATRLLEGVPIDSAAYEAHKVLCDLPVFFVGGPRHGDSINWEPQNYFLVPQDGGGTHWYRYNTQINSMTGERRGVLVYLGLSNNNDPPQVRL